MIIIKAILLIMFAAYLSASIFVGVVMLKNSELMKNNKGLREDGFTLLKIYGCCGLACLFLSLI